MTDREDYWNDPNCPFFGNGKIIPTDGRKSGIRNAASNVNIKSLYDRERRKEFFMARNNDDLVSLWVEGEDLRDLRSMAVLAIKAWYGHLPFADYNLDVAGVAHPSSEAPEDSFRVEVTEGHFAKRNGQERELRYVRVYARDKGLFVSMVEPDPSRRQRHCQLFCRKHMLDYNSKQKYWQDLMHFVYRPATSTSRARLLQLMHVPDGRANI